MSLWDKITVTSTDGDTEYEEGIDYVVDYEEDTIARLPGGIIPDGDHVVVKYAKGIQGDVLEALKENGSAVLHPVKALVKILPSADADIIEEGTDISGKATRLEVVQRMGLKPDRAKITIGDVEIYADCDPSDDVIIGVAIGEVDPEGAVHYTECFRGLVTNREMTSDGSGARSVRITVEDFSISLDAPRKGALGRTWHPTLRREVFRNGAVIADDYRQIRSAGLYDSLEMDDIVELHFAKEHPRAHNIIRECYNLAESEFLDNLVIDCLDFPVLYLDAREKTAGQVIREVASLAGASVKAEGTTLIVSESGFPDGFRTAWIYDALTVLKEEEENKAGDHFTAVQIFGHSETSRLPTKSVYIPATDFTQPGWCRVVDEEGSLEPSEPMRTEEIPQAAELSFQLDGDLYDAGSIRVIGGELASRPTVEIVEGQKVINVTVLIDWVIEDEAGECPYLEDEEGNKLFRIHGRVYDAVPVFIDEKLPIPHANVCRECIAGDDVGETFDINADDEGCYAFEAVPIGRYKIIASAPGYLDNYEDEDPDNNEMRDLYAELQEYEEEIEEGRYSKKATDYHVIVWARPKVAGGPLADLTVSQVLLEVRDEATKGDASLVYGPAIRDERITTEIMARRIGQVMLAESKQARPSVRFRLPMNRWLKAGDGIRISGDLFDLELPEGRPVQATEVRKVIEPEDGVAYDVVSSEIGEVVRSLTSRFEGDPLDTRVGVVIALYRNENGGRVYDVGSSGQVLYGLKAHPVLGEIGVGETVQLARASKGALSYLIVARTTEIFGEERICYV